MKERTISLQEAQQLLESFPHDFSATHPALIITRDDQPVLSLMPYEAHRALLENIASLQTLLEIMASEEAKHAKKSEKAAVMPPHRLSWEEFQKEVGWE